MKKANNQVENNVSVEKLSRLLSGWFNGKHIQESNIRQIQTQSTFT